MRRKGQIYQISWPTQCRRERGGKSVQITGTRLCCICVCLSQQYHYLSTVQINRVRPNPSHIATESQLFWFSVKIFSRSTLAVGGGRQQKFLSGPGPTDGGPGTTLLVLWSKTQISAAHKMAVIVFWVRNSKRDLRLPPRRKWDITQRWVVVMYRRFGTTYRSHLQGSRSPSSTHGSEVRVILVAKSEEHLVLGRPRFRWEDNT
jgi:hypothetical protein